MNGSGFVIRMPVAGVLAAAAASGLVLAGTYQATVIDETMSEKFAGFPVTTDIRTWVVNGIGPVRSQVATGRSGKDTVVTDEELKSFTKG